MREASIKQAAKIEPIGPEQRQQVVNETQRYIELAEQTLERDFPRVPVLFDLSGSSAGMFKAVGAECWIRYNPWIFAKHFEENFNATVPHEVAHYIVHAVYPRRRVKPHGAQWQAVMACFDADPSVTYKLDISGVPGRRQRRHRYVCLCREHQVSSTRHNRVSRGEAVYRCNACHGELVPGGPDARLPGPVGE